MITKLVAGLAASLVSFSALAVQKDITVTANVDTSLEMTLADGTALPAAVAMTYWPGQGLRPVQLTTKIFANDATQDMEIRLISDPELVENSGATPVRVPLGVRYNNQTLSTAPVTLAASTAFPGGDTTNGSVIMPLEISQKTLGALTKTGNYQGVVSLAVVHAAGGP